jgi:murein DD-endopeptidase MepM/ murein hydrolase activator NlpD
VFGPDSLRFVLRQSRLCLPLRASLILRCLVLVATFSIVIPLTPAATLTVQAQPARLVNGAPVLFRVKSLSRLDSLAGSWLGHQIVFSFDASSKTWFALAGVSLETTPGSYALELTGQRTGTKAVREKLSFTRKISVMRAKYPKVELTVSKQFTEPDPNQVKQIEADQKTKKDYLNRVTPEREWSGNFTAPADAAISDAFGTQRVFNGKTQSSHQGLDFRVPSGTPVAAMNQGIVLLARPLYFEGNCVVIDHGQGLLTIYMHLSQFAVKEGDHVKRGQQVGLSGGTGRATGPHLHVAVRWQGTYLDPASLLRLRLP